MLKIFASKWWRKRERTPATGAQALIHGLQVQSWRISGIEDRLNDASFPFSGFYEAPPDIEAGLATLLMLVDVAVGRPIVSRNPLTTAYQEKLSPPFFYNAWFRLQAADALPASLVLGRDVSLASAPTGQLYPVTYREALSKEIAVVFDAN